MIVPAAGSGSRLGPGVPKALRRVAGETLLVHAVRRLRECPSVHQVVVAAPPEAITEVTALLSPYDVVVVAGGAERRHSVAAGLRVLADEVVQEVFLSVWNNAATYDQSRGSVRSWLMLLTHRRAVDAVRREESVRRVAEAASREPLPVPDEPGDTVEQSWLLEERTLVRESLAGLPEPQREVIELMYFSGLSQTKVAERLQIPLGTVKSRSLLAMKRLRRSIVVVER